jgi:hypothetical protein
VAKVNTERKPLVILESPYRGHGESDGEIKARTRWNVDYARECLRNSILRGEAPIASHLLYTQEGVLNDNIPGERSLGIACGLVWLPVANYSVYYTDHGWSTGMLAALHDVTLKIGFDFKIRSLKGRNAIQLPSTLHEEIEQILINHCED